VATVITSVTDGPSFLATVKHISSVPSYIVSSVTFFIVYPFALWYFIVKTTGIEMHLHIKKLATQSTKTIT
jgi:hypothetical protein